MAYSKEEREALEAALLRDRARVVRKLTRLSENVHDADGHTAFSLHMADEGTDTMQREQAFLLASEEGRTLQAIDDALRRLYRAPERFGFCAACSEPVGLARLEAIPHAAHCISCQTQQERERPLE